MSSPVDLAIQAVDNGAVWVRCAERDVIVTRLTPFADGRSMAGCWARPVAADEQTIALVMCRRKRGAVGYPPRGVAAVYAYRRARIGVAQTVTSRAQ